MEHFDVVTGPVAALDRDNVDTDQIIPKQFLKRIERTGYGQFLFWDWAKDDDFPLNRPEFERAPILVAGANFGCGSSREHAAWALGGRGLPRDHRPVVRRHLPLQLRQERSAHGRAAPRPTCGS